MGRAIKGAIKGLRERDSIPQTKEGFMDEFSGRDE